ncbi:hypothetical protein M9Y10_018706 [Tritrichomonas musculus]|uniref:Uncharacterized protein n=1 Tax=Tritrichomonas musculus TaxID=1915356 RepID=A0ABR2HMM7_9EUKA
MSKITYRKENNMCEKSLFHIKDAFIYISGYEWGPGVSKVIVSLSHMYEKAIKDGASIMTRGKERTITNIYLSDEKGNQVTGNSTFVTLELAIVFDSRVSPFYYNLATYQNQWVSKYVVQATFHVTANGKDQTVSFQKDLINNRICPDTEQFNNRGNFSGKYKNTFTNEEELLTLQYAAYEPKQLKKDNQKNPLIIWIHGQGEGGTDIDIALLGNEVTALARSKIQSYFTTPNGENGAYVLVIQCQTYWMDGGDGENSNGDVISRYTEIFIDMVKKYFTENPDVDTNRVYIGGCSNGGYMTMNMLIQYPQYWAASYMVCEGYPFMIFKRDEDGNYISEGNSSCPTAYEISDQRFFTDEKINSIKHIPMWFIQSHDDTIVIGSRYSFSSYRELLKKGAKNCWYSYFKNVKGVDIPGMKYFGHWSWIPLFNDQVTTVQNREKIMNSNDNDKFGLVPSNNGGGFQEAVDDKGTYKSIFAWLNAQVKK